MKTLSDLLAPFKSAILGTHGSNGYPFSSYAPFYYDGIVVYVFISNIATHTKNIHATPKASAFFVEDESITENIFKRKRISLQCDVKSINKKSEEFTKIMKEFQEKHPDGTLTMLMGMNDFNLYALTPIYGEATFGFGEAYNIGGEKMNKIVPRTTETGHK